ncbi:hypothetical protein P3L10_020363 [Capsicum annuum]
MPKQVEQQPLKGCECAVCFIKRPFILHRLPYRGVYRHLCTACVLDSHPGSFCPVCFDVFLHNPPPSHLCLPCSKCTSISHLSCVSDAASSSQGYLCPPCSNPNFTFFYVTPNHDNTIQINRHLAKQMVAAATIASESIHSAADMAWINAENRVNEALLSKAEAAQTSNKLKNLPTLVPDTSVKRYKRTQEA